MLKYVEATLSSLQGTSQFAFLHSHSLLSSVPKFCFDNPKRKLSSTIITAFLNEILSNIRVNGHVIHRKWVHGYDYSPALLGYDFDRSGSIDCAWHAVEYRMGRTTCVDDVLDELRRNAPPRTSLTCGCAKAARLHAVYSASCARSSVSSLF